MEDFKAKVLEIASRYSPNYYYRCGASITKDPAKAAATGVYRICDLPSFKAKIFDDALWRFVVRDIVQFPEKYIRRWEDEVRTGAKKKELEAKVERLSKQLEKSQKAIERLYEQLGDPELDSTIIKKMITQKKETNTEIEQKLYLAKAELQEIDEATKHYATVEELHRRWEKAMEPLEKIRIRDLVENMTNPQKKAFLKSAFNRLEITAFKEPVERKNIQDIFGHLDPEEAENIDIDQMLDILSHLKFEAEYNVEQAVYFLNTLHKGRTGEMMAGVKKKSGDVPCELIKTHFVPLRFSRLTPPSPPR